MPPTARIVVESQLYSALMVHVINTNCHASSILGQGNRGLIGLAMIPDQTPCCSHFRRLKHTAVRLAFADLEPNRTESKYLEGRR